MTDDLRAVATELDDVRARLIGEGYTQDIGMRLNAIHDRLRALLARPVKCACDTCGDPHPPSWARMQELVNENNALSAEIDRRAELARPVDEPQREDAIDNMAQEIVAWFITAEDSGYEDALTWVINRLTKSPIYRTPIVPSAPANERVESLHPAHFRDGRNHTCVSVDERVERLEGLLREVLGGLSSDLQARIAEELGR